MAMARQPLQKHDQSQQRSLHLSAPELPGHSTRQGCTGRMQRLYAQNLSSLKCTRLTTDAFFKIGGCNGVASK